MEIKASLNYFRMSPRKVRLVANLIKGMRVEEARNQLRFSSKKAAGPILKLLNSAVANAENNFDLNIDTLVIKNITVNSGPSLKRSRPRAFGRAALILKRTSHIEIVLEGKKKAIKTKRQEPAEVEKVARKKMMSKEPLKDTTSGAAEKMEDIKKERIKRKKRDVLGSKKFLPKKLDTVRRIFQRKSI